MKKLRIILSVFLTISLLLAIPATAAIQNSNFDVEDLMEDPDFVDFARGLWTYSYYDEDDYSAIIIDCLFFPNNTGYSSRYPNENAMQEGLSIEHLKTFLYEKYNVPAEAVDLELRILTNNPQEKAFAMGFNSVRVLSPAGYGDPLFPCGIHSVEKKDDVYSVYLYGEYDYNHSHQTNWGTPESEIYSPYYWKCDVISENGNWKQISSERLYGLSYEEYAQIDVRAMKNAAKEYAISHNCFGLCAADPAARTLDSVGVYIYRIDPVFDGYVMDCELTFYARGGKPVLDDFKRLSYVEDLFGVSVEVDLTFTKGNGYQVSYANQHYSQYETGFMGQIKDTEGEGLSLRPTAGTNHEKFFLIPTGENIYINWVDKEWGSVSYGDHSGWVNMKYVERKNLNIY